MPFDSLTAARKLEAAGVEPKQAEAMVQTVSDALTGEFATKADLIAMGADLRGEIGGVRQEIAELRGDTRLLKWMFGVLVVFNSAILVRLFMQ